MQVFNLQIVFRRGGGFWRIKNTEFYLALWTIICTFVQQIWSLRKKPSSRKKVGYCSRQILLQILFSDIQRNFLKNFHIFEVWTGLN